MKIFGFNLSSEKKFVHVTCNIILLCMISAILGLSIFFPIAKETYSATPQPVFCGDKSKNNVSLMINVYWGTEFLDEMLEILDRNNVKTTFFVGGCWVAKNNEMLEKINKKGHEIANHGYFHKDHAKISSKQNQDEIYMTQELIENLIGTKTSLFAPPSGSYNEKVVTIAENLGYKTIMWSRDTIDWRDKDRDLILKRAVEKTVGGDLILMHPTQATVSCLDDIIKGLKKKNLNITTVTNTLNFTGA